ARAAAWGLANVRFAREWMIEDALVARYVAPAHVCLGIFGASRKAARVLPTKALLALAVGRPLVTRDSPAARESLVDGEHAPLCLRGRARRRRPAPARRPGVARAPRGRRPGPRRDTICPGAPRPRPPRRARHRGAGEPRPLEPVASRPRGGALARRLSPPQPI